MGIICQICRSEKQGKSVGREDWKQAMQGEMGARRGRVKRVSWEYECVEWLFSSISDYSSHFHSSQHWQVQVGSWVLGT